MAQITPLRLNIITAHYIFCRDYDDDERCRQRLQKIQSSRAMSGLRPILESLRNERSLPSDQAKEIFEELEYEKLRKECRW